jgi:hypothetical protein
MFPRVFSVNLPVVCLLATTPVTAQRVAEPVATFPEPFSQVVGIRQLSDGRLIIADRLEQHVSYIDFTRGTLRQIGREGEGPGEYRQPMDLAPFPDDGTLLTDFGNMRISLIDNQGRINQSWPMMRPGPDGGMQFVRPSATDGEGNIYFSTTGMVMRGRGASSPTPSDSGYLFRVDLENETTDTVATLYSEPIQQDGQQSVRISGGSARIQGFSVRPFRTEDAWGVAPDGRIAIVRATNYSVDWLNPDGHMVVGTATPYERVRITQKEKEAWAERSSGNTVSMVVSGSGGSGSGSNSFSVPTPDVDEMEFPEYMPPFGTGAVNVAPNGDVWVRLNRSADNPEPLFDVFNSNGRKVRQVQLEQGRRLVGFGTGSFYAVLIDEDDLQWLEQYSYPADR